MAHEIERKFLVANDTWRRDVVAHKDLCQFYLAAGDRSNVRVRITDQTRARLTIKSAEPGIRRSEFEYEIPVADAEAMLALALGQVIRKRRHIVPAGELRWEIDVFQGAHEGLIMAEIELATTDQAFSRPDWLGAEVTNDPAYYNAALAFAGAAERPKRG